MPFHSLLWGWCQPRSRLAAPTKVGISPSLSSGFSRWCQVESQPPCKTELQLVLGTRSPLAFTPTRCFLDTFRATCSPPGWHRAPPHPHENHSGRGCTHQPCLIQLSQLQEKRGVALDELFGCPRCPSPSSPPCPRRRAQHRPQPGAPVAFSIHYSSSWKSRLHEAIRAGGAGAGQRRQQRHPGIAGRR